jgi:hypothetical protein
MQCFEMVRKSTRINDLYVAVCKHVASQCKARHKTRFRNGIEIKMRSVNDVKIGTKTTIYRTMLSWKRNIIRQVLRKVPLVGNNMSKRYYKMDKHQSSTIKRRLALMVNVASDPGDPKDQFDMDDVAFALSNTIRFDTDSIPVKVDNCCTKTMSGFESDFIKGTMKVLVGVNVYGFADSKSQITHTGTIRWRTTDDERIEHDICVPNSYYVPGRNARLLSPQHWAQEVNDNYPSIDGTWCANFHDRVVLAWHQRTYKKTILLDKS